MRQMTDLDSKLRQRFQKIVDKKKRYGHVRETDSYMMPTLNYVNAHLLSPSKGKNQKSLKILLNSPSEMSDTMFREVGRTENSSKMLTGPRNSVTNMKASVNNTK